MAEPTTPATAFRAAADIAESLAAGAQERQTRVALHGILTGFGWLVYYTLAVPAKFALWTLHILYSPIGFALRPFLYIGRLGLAVAMIPVKIIIIYEVRGNLHRICPTQSFHMPILIFSHRISSSTSPSPLSWVFWAGRSSVSYSPGYAASSPSTINQSTKPLNIPAKILPNQSTNPPSAPTASRPTPTQPPAAAVAAQSPNTANRGKIANKLLAAQRE
jgi:hypothetical protein